LACLPFSIAHVGVPPIKCQGIKTKLVPFLFSSLQWEEKGRWIEPFLGSGVVAFNLAPRRDLLADTNRHIIGLYQGIYHVGSSEELRNAMDEALLIKPGFATPEQGKQKTRREPERDLQLTFALEKKRAYPSQI
jgi:site-specific DNA-adenine methylase